jgi:Icc-related predicted phosphoesterase
MIVLLGDLHGNLKQLKRLDEIVEPGVPFLQVGDLGWYPDIKDSFIRWGQDARRKLYWIKGNHEYFPHVPVKAEEPVEMHENLVYVPGGYVLELDGRRIGCLGGASSIDRKWRTPMFDWFPEENILPEEEKRARQWKDIDVMVTHVPPQPVIERNFSRTEMVKMWEVDYGWTDMNAVIVKEIWHDVGCPPLYCGHMHRSLQDGNVRILDINEAVEI